LPARYEVSLNQAEVDALRQIRRRHVEVLDGFERDLLQRVLRKVDRSQDRTWRRFVWTAEDIVVLQRQAADVEGADLQTVSFADPDELMDEIDRIIAGVEHKDRLVFERELRVAGFQLVAGVDEVARAAWAGPMVAAAVILGDDFDIKGLRDSKKMKAEARRRHDERIRSDATAVGIARVTPEAIDSRGIDECHMQVLRDAVANLDPQPEFVLVDHYEIPDLPLPQNAIPTGDDASASIAAASIVAKVECDRIMEAAEATHPGYGFARNKGYGTPEHRQALARLGPSPIHRRSVGPVGG